MATSNNALAVPTTTPPTDAQSAITTLTSCCGTSLTISQALSGDWILSPASDLTAAQLRAGLRALDEELKGGPQKPIGAAILELLGATDRPPQLSDVEAVARTQALKQMAWDYPIDVVQNACRNWRRVPSKGRWWPTEQDLRAQCEPLFASRKSLRTSAANLLQHLEVEEDRAERLRRAEQASYFAGDLHKQFRRRMEERLLSDQVAVYFTPNQIKYVGSSTVHVRTLVAQAIFERYGLDVIGELGITLVHAPESFLRERDIPREMSATEDAEVSRKMTRLNQAVKSGESIEKLRRSGEL